MCGKKTITLMLVVTLMLALVQVNAVLALPSNEHLLGHWMFNDPVDDGKTSDAGGNNIEGTIVGNVTLMEDEGAFDDGNKCYSFDGNSYVELMTSGPISDDFTVSLWVYATDPGFRNLMGVGNVAWLKRESGEGKLTSPMFKELTIESKEGLKSNKWYLLGLSRSAGGQYMLYKKAADEDTADVATGDNANTFKLTTLEGLNIASKGSTFGSKWQGYIDDVRLYNGRALTEGDMDAIFAATLPNQQSAEITPERATFDKNPSYQEDIEITLTLNGKTLDGLKNGDTPLAEGNDYTIAGNVCTIKKEYLETLEAHTTVDIQFDFSAGADRMLRIEVVNSAVLDAEISPAKAEFDRNTQHQQDIEVTLTPNGNTLQRITNGSEELVQGTDYEISGNSCTIKKAYLAGLSLGVSNLIFDFDAGADPELEVTVMDTTVWQVIQHNGAGLILGYDGKTGSFTMTGGNSTEDNSQWVSGDAGGGSIYIENKVLGERLSYDKGTGTLAMVSRTVAGPAVEWQFAGVADNWCALLNPDSNKRLRYDVEHKKFDMVDPSDPNDPYYGLNEQDASLLWEMKDYEGTNLLGNSGFEHGNTERWDGNGAKLAVETATVHTGMYAVRAYERTEKWHGVKQDVLEKIKAAGAGTYRFSAMVRLAEGTGKAMVRTSINNKNNDVQYDVNATEWTKVEQEFKVINADTATGAYVLVRMGDDTLADILVDDCVLEKLPPADPSNVLIEINPSAEKWTISKDLLGLHFVYPLERDYIYSDGSFAKWVKNNKIWTSRFPGGTVVKYWDWQNPTGVFKGDHWAPNWDPANQEPDFKWMSVDEYLAFCDESGMEPMMGVNLNSGHRYNRVEDSVQRAKELLQYCIDKGYNIKWWYLGNEEGYPIDRYINYINRHAQAMKEIDPDIKFIINSNHLGENNLRTFLRGAGDNIDVAEYHHKWYSFKVKSTPEMWKVEFPLFNGKIQQRMDTFRRVAEEEGYPNLLIANNEWGITESMEGFTKYESSLVAVDFLLELFRTGHDQACLWNTQWTWDPPKPMHADMHLLDHSDHYKLNPMGRGFELLSTALEDTMIEMTSNQKPVYGFASKDSTGSKYQLYLMNKFGEDAQIKIDVDGISGFKNVAASIMKDPGLQVEDQAISYNGATQQYETTLPPYSFVRIVFSDQAIVLPDVKAPGEVENVKVTAGDGKLTVNWTDPADQDLSTVVLYTDSEAPGAMDEDLYPDIKFPVTAAKGMSTATKTGLLNGTEYELTIKTVDEYGNMSQGVIVKGTPVASQGGGGLKEKITEAEGLNEKDYTAETWSLLQTALTAAIAVRDNTAATQEEIDRALADLQAAIDGLKQEKLFAITSANNALDRVGGIRATVNVEPVNGGVGREGDEVVVFQLMKDTTPISIVAVEKDILSAEEFTAYFNVADPDNTKYTVKVFVFNEFNSDTNAPISLAEPKLMQ